MVRRFVNRHINDDKKASADFGDVLRQTREQHGISLSEVARELRVREDILIAIENSDFSKIPPQGYSRNMIKSYSRLLGLNANTMTNMFLDSEYSYQLGKKRASFQKMKDENKRRVPIYENESGPIRTPREQLESRKYNRPKPTNPNPGVTSSFGNRQMHNMRNEYKNTPRFRRELDNTNNVSRAQADTSSRNRFKRDLFGADDHDSARRRLEARMNAHSNSTSNAQSGYNTQATSSFRGRGLKQRDVIGRKEASTFTDEENPNFTGTEKKPKSGYQFMNVYHSKNNSAQTKLSIPIIAGIVVVLLIILILVLFFVGKQNEDNKADVSNISVTGLTDPEKADENSQNNPKEEPKEVEFTYKVKDGQSCYLEIYENGSSKSSFAKEVKSGETKTYKVTDTLKVVTTKPSAIEFTVGGKTAEAVDNNKTGVYTLTVDFKQYLADWKKANGIVDASSNTSQTQAQSQNTNKTNSSSASSSTKKSTSSSSSSKTKKKTR